MEAIPRSREYIFRTKRKVSRTGVLLVGIGGNNGTTVLSGILANQKNMTWQTKNGVQKANYFGSITHAGTTYLGINKEKNEEIFVPLRSLLPMLHGNDLVVDGWDINDMPLDEALTRAQVYPYTLQEQLKPLLKKLGKPMKSIYYPDFIASNQNDRANNILPGNKCCIEHLTQIRKDIRTFKAKHKLDTVVVLWTANTERYCEVLRGVHDTEENLLRAIAEGHKEIAPSQMFAVASLLEGCSYINGSPQNTFVPAIITMAQQRKLFIGGDDFKSGQTKLKSVLVDFLVASGLKPTSIVSYNHLGNNDGKNLIEEKQFRSKEISKSNVVDDMVHSNNILYSCPDGKDKPDHVVVIKYVPSVGDSKRAMDEYIASIFMGGAQTIAIHNTCEDSLLAAPIIIDLVVLTELFQRIEWKVCDNKSNNDNFGESLPGSWDSFGSILTILSFLLKAPLVPDDSPLVNALFKQRGCLENILRACAGLPPINDMHLEKSKGCKKKKLVCFFAELRGVLFQIDFVGVNADGWDRYFCLSFFFLLCSVYIFFLPEKLLIKILFFRDKKRSRTSKIPVHKKNLNNTQSISLYIGWVTCSFFFFFATMIFLINYNKCRITTKWRKFNI
ncbi:hypothetical protein RFI_03128 [Reticulomyxa filosa]|uniref:Inositol-3-phosphate synthase n=1 Tax=Reticulomyxa filosa TaxID=46433 RepID=X6P625_RETFI|nr:hypothetical protein RFI_03128 [Reticulomyxa filosa]|eukprot:ETO33965.1 hypothetical protein RFI_03128 [Reticulomyxa filosa]